MFAGTGKHIFFSLATLVPLRESELSAGLLFRAAKISRGSVSSFERNDSTLSSKKPISPQ